MGRTGRKIAAHEARFAVFETSLGACGIAWSGAGVTAIALPEIDGGDVAARFDSLANRAEMPDWVRAIARDVTAHLDGDVRTFAATRVDLGACSEFDRAVYAAARAIAPGSTRTYGALAQDVGKPGAARAIGGAMSRNPVPIVVPCHRVLASHGLAGGFSAPGGLDTKRRLLAIEGVALHQSHASREG